MGVDFLRIALCRYLVQHTPPPHKYVGLGSLDCNWISRSTSWESYQSASRWAKSATDQGSPDEFNLRNYQSKSNRLFGRLFAIPTSLAWWLSNRRCECCGRDDLLQQHIMITSNINKNPPPTTPPITALDLLAGSDRGIIESRKLENQTVKIGSSSWDVLSFINYYQMYDLDRNSCNTTPEWSLDDKRWAGEMLITVRTPELLIDKPLSLDK